MLVLMFDLSRLIYVNICYLMLVFGMVVVCVVCGLVLNSCMIDLVVIVWFIG